MSKACVPCSGAYDAGTAVARIARQVPRCAQTAPLWLLLAVQFIDDFLAKLGDLPPSVVNLFVFFVKIHARFFTQGGPVQSSGIGGDALGSTRRYT